MGSAAAGTIAIHYANNPAGEMTISCVPSAREQIIATVTGPDGYINGGGLNCPSACTATAPYASTVTLSAPPDAGYRQTAWTGDCVARPAAYICALSMSGEKTVGAIFVPSFQVKV